MKKNNKKVSSKIPEGYPEFDTPNPTPSPHGFLCTKKQYDVMVLLKEGLNISQIARKLNINESSVRDRLKSPIKNNLVYRENYSYGLTDKGNIALNKFGVGVGGAGGNLKNIHNNNFTVKINSLPRDWSFGKAFINRLKPQDVYYNKSSSQWYLYFERFTIRICESKNIIDFYIKKIEGSFFDEIMGNVWDEFICAFQLLKKEGFDLDYNVHTKNPHFADPTGFFAMLSSKFTKDGMEIDTSIGKFWVDYSQGQNTPEEETDSVKLKERMERLSKSAFETNIDFFDLEKMTENLREVNKSLVALLNLQLSNNSTEKKEVNYIG